MLTKYVMPLHICRQVVYFHSMPMHYVLVSFEIHFIYSGRSFKYTFGVRIRIFFTKMVCKNCSSLELIRNTALFQIQFSHIPFFLISIAFHSKDSKWKLSFRGLNLRKFLSSKTTPPPALDFLAVKLIFQPSFFNFTNCVTMSLIRG